MIDFWMHKSLYIKKIGKELSLEKFCACEKDVFAFYFLNSAYKNALKVKIIFFFDNDVSPTLMLHPLVCWGISYNR